MPSLTLQGVVLRFANYRDHDRMLTLLSPEHGRIDALSRDCRRPKSRLLPASELFVHGEFVLYQSRDRYAVTSASLTDTFYPLRLDHDRLTCASYLLGLCHAAAQPEEEANALYRLLLRGLYRLAYCEGEDPLGLTAAFLLLYADTIGYRPRLHHCAHCRISLDRSESALMDIAAGGLVCPACGTNAAYRLSEGQVAWMRNTLRDGLENGQTKTGALETVSAPEMVSVLRRYVESRLEATIKAGRLLP